MILPSIIIFISFFLAFYFYNKIPGDVVATHWGTNNQVNGYSSKFVGLFITPIISIFLLVVFSVLPKVDPYKKNFSQFSKYFQNFINIIFIFLFYIYCLTLFWNLGYSFNMIQFLSPGLALIFYYAGVLTSHARRNWFVGFRTPWTMSSPKVWEKTHQVGGKLFKLIAFITLLSLIFPNLSIFFILIPVFIVVIFIFIYSYFIYQKIK